MSIFQFFMAQLFLSFLTHSLAIFFFAFYSSRHHFRVLSCHFDLLNLHYLSICCPNSYSYVNAGVVFLSFSASFKFLEKPFRLLFRIRAIFQILDLIFVSSSSSHFNFIAILALLDVCLFLFLVFQFFSSCILKVLVQMRFSI